MQNAGSADEGRALLSRTRAVHLAMVSEAGTPILRTVDAVVVGDALAFHGIEGIGRPVVASAHEIVATIPDAQSTFYLSVQVDGVLERVDDHAELRLDRLSFEAKLGQDRQPGERLRVIEQLWQRGAPGDVAAIALLLRRFPELGTPAFLRPRDALQLQCGLADDELEDVIDLLDGLYWLTGVTRAQLRSAVLASSALVAARDTEGRLVAFARAVSDSRCAWIYDVVVAEHLRGTHVGSTVMEVLLDHPAVRVARHVRLSTRDAMSFYRRLGFRDLAEARRHPWVSTEMVRFGRSERADEAKARGAVADERNEERLT